MLKKLILSLVCLVATLIPTMAQSAPDACYLVGAYNNWVTPDVADLSTMHTLTDADADGIYYGKFNLGVEDFNFKVFIAVTNWNDGSKYFGANKEISWATINTEKYTATFENSGNIYCPDWDGGEIEMYYDYPNNQFWFEVERPCIYMKLPELSNPDDVVATPILFQTDEPNCYTAEINFSANEVISFYFISDLDYTEVYAPKENTDVVFDINNANAIFEDTFIHSTKNNNNCWTIKDFPGGKVTFVVNTELQTLSVYYNIAKSEDCIYLVGAPSGWVEPSEANSDYYQDYCLILEENGIYAGTFDINAGEMMFRIYSKLTGWDKGDSYGSQANDSPIDVAMTDGVYQGEIVKGKGSWNFPEWQGGKVEILVNMQAMTITVHEIIDIPEEKTIQITSLVVSDITETSAKISFTVTTSDNFIGDNAVIYINNESATHFPIETASVDCEYTLSDLQPGETQSVSVFVAIGEIMSNVETVSFTTSGIDGIEVENAPVEYINLQGVRIANPENGLFIRRQGNKVEKILK